MATDSKTIDRANTDIKDPVEHAMKSYFSSSSKTEMEDLYSEDKDSCAADIGRQLDESQQMIMALTTDYMAVYMVDLEADRACVLKLDSVIRDRVLKTEIPKSFCYSEIFKAYAENRILEADRENFINAVMPERLNSIFSRGRDKYELNYRILVNGKQKHYSCLFIRISRQDEDLRLIVGFRNIDDVIDIQEQTRKEGIYSAYTAVSDAYLSMHRVNVRKNTYAAIKTTDAIRRHELPDSNRFDENVRSIIRGLAREESYRTALKFLDITTLSERMKGRIHLTTRFEGRIAGTCRLHFFKENDDEAGNLEHAIFAVEVTDEDKYQSVFEVLARGFQNIFWIDPGDGTARILKLDGYVTEGLEKENHKYNSFSYEVLLKQYIKDRVFEEDRQHLYDKLSIDGLRRAFADRDEYIGNYRVLIDGSIHHYQYSYIKISNTDYLVAGFQNIDSIIEEHLEAEKKEKAREEAHQRELDRKTQEHQRQLAQALEAAQQANRAKSTFLNSMSHDIRTPMNAIIGFTALAQAHITEQKQVQDYLSKISTSGAHLLSLINDILDMSRIESGKVKLDEKPVHIPDLLHDLRIMIQGLVNAKNQNLYIDTQDVVHEDVITDKLRLNQVLINIVGNAIKFTQPGGDIIIRLIEKPCSLRNCTTYEFFVKDNGVGMSQEFLGHIFDTFSRERNSTVSGIQGTGLGMAITKNIVDMMGGDIRVESELGKGSAFTVTVNMQLASEPVKREPIEALLGARVLVVDDDLDVCRSVSKMLRDIKMRPDWSSSGKEAILRAQDAADMKDEYKVYIIDYLMPDMNGIETVRRIRRVISEDASIIVLTAYDWADFEQEAREAGVTAFVSKPIFMSELRNVLTQPADTDRASQEAEKQSYDYSERRVLLVEDNELNREIATAILEEMGIRVDSVCDGDEAVEVIGSSEADRYDLVFMDIQMPKMDGYTATREIRTLPDNRKANIPIVAMTANAFAEDRQRAYETGMNGHIIKPVSIKAIAEVLDNIFAKNGKGLTV